MRHHDLQMHSVPLNAEMLAKYDCVLIATHHSVYDWAFIAKHAKLIVDTRGVMRNIPGNHDHIVPA